MTQLREWVIGALLIATLTVGVTGFISDGLSKYNSNVGSNASTGELDKLEKVSNVTSIADESQQRAENIDVKSNFFTLPGLVKTFSLAFESIAIWDVFIGVTLDATGLNLAHGNWLATFASAAVVVTITFIFARRILG